MKRSAPLANADGGLSSREAAKRLLEEGPNAIPAEKTTWQQLLVRQFRSPFVYLLAGAAAVSAMLSQAEDAIVILLFVLVNAALGFSQEYRSEQTLRLLRNYVRAHARVRRDGQVVSIPREDIVRGDVVLLSPGDRLPADVRFLHCAGTLIDESALTGESEPSAKSPGSSGSGGTTVVSGKAEAVVTHIGAASAIGEIAKLTAAVPRESTFEKGLASFSSFILKLIVVTVVIVFIVNLALEGGKANVVELLLFSIALAVSVIPEALPVVMTFSLSRGARMLAAHKVVVKRLSAIEDLGSIEVLCADKTGTLTENHLTIDAVHGKDGHEVVSAAAMAAPDTAVGMTEDPFDRASREGVSVKERSRVASRTLLMERPFDPTRRRNAALVEDAGHRFLIVRGAPETVFEMCTGISAAEHKVMETWMKEQGARGCRVLAVARRPLAAKETPSDAKEEHLHLLGLIAFLDPIKDSAEGAIRHARALGVQVKILTGDAPAVAGAVAYKIGLVAHPEEVMDGLSFAALSSEEQHEAVKRFSVFARVTPRQKYEIIRLLREGAEVGFLGEGINDAPALNAAHVGLVVQGASDIASEAADIILLDRSLAVIINGIHEGRSAFVNSVKYIRATLASSFGNFFAIAAASFLLPYLPLLPLQILLVNCLTDFPMIAVSTDRTEAVEGRRPRQYDIRGMALIALVLGAVSTAFDFVFFAAFKGYGPDILRTAWFVGSVLTELVFILSIRSRRLFFKAPRMSWPLGSLIVVAFAAAMTLPYLPFTAHVFGFVALPLGFMLAVLGITAAYFVATEAAKLGFYRFARSANKIVHSARQT